MNFTMTKNTALFALMMTVFLCAAPHDAYASKRGNMLDWMFNRDFGTHLNLLNRDLHHYHGGAWANSNEGLDRTHINADVLIKNMLQLGVIKSVSILGSTGNVHVTPIFYNLSLRDKEVLSIALDSLFKARKGNQYRVFFYKDGGKSIASYGQYGLDLY